MSKFACIVLILQLTSSCNEREKATLAYNDLFFDNLKGKVLKTVEIPFTIDSISGELLPDSCCINSIEYDSKGYRTRQVTAHLNGHEQTGQIYTRFSNGLVKELTFTKNEKLISTLISTLNEKGKYARAEDYDSSGKLNFYYTAIIVNEYGKIISFKKYLPDNSYAGTITNQYNREFWVGGTVTDSSGKNNMSTALQINPSGEPVKETVMMTGDGGAVTTVTRYEYDNYDNNGNWTAKSELDKEGKRQRRIKRQIFYVQ